MPLGGRVGEAPAEPRLGITLPDPKTVGLESYVSLLNPYSDAARKCDPHYRMPDPQSSSGSLPGSLDSRFTSGSAAGFSSTVPCIDSALPSDDSVGSEEFVESVPRDEESGLGRRGPVRSGGNEDG